MKQIFGIAMLLAAAASSAGAQTSDARAAVEATKRIVAEVVAKSFPELASTPIEVRAFGARDVFFETRFSLARFATFRAMHPIIYVNPRVFALGAPGAGLRAIVAHELGHALYYVGRNRLRLLGLAALLDGDFAAGFERRTDLVALERGYGAGLREYRVWLYGVVSGASLAKKRRDYFTPAEIDLIVAAADADAGVFTRLRAVTPRTPDQTKDLLAARPPIVK